MEYYTTKQVAELYKVGEATIVRWIKQGRFPHSKKSSGEYGNWLIPQCCVDDPDGKAHRQGASRVSEPSEGEKLQAYRDRLEREALEAGYMSANDLRAKIKEVNESSEALAQKVEEYEPKFAEADRLAGVRRELATAISENKAVTQENEAEQVNIKRVKARLQKQYDDFIKEKKEVAQKSTNNDKLVNAMLCIQNLVKDRQITQDSKERVELENEIQNWLLRITRIYGVVYKVRVEQYPNDPKRKGQGYYREMLSRTKDGSDLPEQYALYEGVDNA